MHMGVLRMYLKYVVIDGKCPQAVNCAWCRSVVDRLTNQPLLEPLQTTLKNQIQSHGICEPCANSLILSRKKLVVSQI
jgi:hypothetical protein